MNKYKELTDGTQRMKYGHIGYKDFHPDGGTYYVQNMGGHYKHPTDGSWEWTLDVPKLLSSFELDPSSWKFCREQCRSELHSKQSENLQKLQRVRPGLGRRSRAVGRKVSNNRQGLTQATTLHPVLSPIVDIQPSSQGVSINIPELPNLSDIPTTARDWPGLSTDTQSLLPLTNGNRTVSISKQFHKTYAVFRRLRRLSCLDRLIVATLSICALSVTAGLTLGVVTSSVEHGTQLVGVIAGVGMLILSCILGMHKFRRCQCENSEKDEKERLV